jgi:glyoxylase-like metal-dependent hydrolase (beta-lactamase superfamily II)
MALRVHHFSAGTLCPVGARLVLGEGSLFGRAELVCHCLLVEGGDGLILVDTGMGTADLADVEGRLGRWFATVAAPRRDPAGTALAAVERLGFRASDVRHIVPTHLDLDHAGGLPDFPSAEVHVHAAEHDAAMNPRSAMERSRYRRAHWAHGPRWNPRSRGGDDWMGFTSVQAIDGSDDVLLIPLHGHTRGHCGVAVRTADGWLLHAGDAYFHHREVASEPACPPALRAFQRLAAVDDELRRANQARLRELACAGRGVRMHSAHCPVELRAFAGARGSIAA